MDSLRISSNVRSIINEEGAVLLDLKRGTYFSLNGVGSEIWRGLESGSTLREIKRRLQQAYPAASDELDADVEDFVSKLMRDGLVGTDV